MTFTYGQSDVVVNLEPVKASRGRKPMSRRIYSRYGRLKERTVQELCDAIGGDVVYLEAQVAGGRAMMPVHSWGRTKYAGTSGNPGQLTYAADFLQACMAKDIPVVAYGAERFRWKLSVANVEQSSARDALDAESDSPTAPVAPVNAPPLGGMREEF